MAFSFFKNNWKKIVISDIEPTSQVVGGAEKNEKICIKAPCKFYFIFNLNFYLFFK